MSADDMTPMPMISYDQTNNPLVFNTPVQTTLGIASAASETFEFKSPALFKQSVQAGFNASLSDFVPMSLPYDPMSLTIPAINSIGRVQATDLMIAKSGVMILFSDISRTHIFGDITVYGNITNTNLQGQLKLKAPLLNPTFSRTCGGLSKAMVNLANVGDTNDLAKPMSTTTQIALGAKRKNLLRDTKQYK